MSLYNFFVTNINATNLAWSVLVYLLIATAALIWRTPRYPTTIPWVGHGHGWLAGVLNVINAFKNCRRWMLDGYKEYNKQGRAFVLPPILGAFAEVVLPRDQMQWMIDQPDKILGAYEASYDILGGEYLFIDRIVLGDPYHDLVIHKNLARNMAAMLPEIDDQVCREVERFIGRSEDWHRVNILDLFMKSVPRITNRILVGQNLCENDDFLYHAEAFVHNIIRGFLVFPFTPQALKPIIGRFLGLFSKYHAWKAAKHSLPVIKQRLAVLKADEESKRADDLDVPNDYITWHIKTALTDGRPAELDPWRISMRIMPLNFAAMHTTGMTGHAALLDILSADPSVLEQLREEAERVFKEEGGRWTKKGLAKLYRMDSAIRESQRYGSFAMTFVHRKVLAKEGITGPDGTHYAQGCVLSSPWWPVSRDEDLYPGADKYDAFRFSRDREAYEAKPVTERDSAESLKLKQTAMVTTSEIHIPFGHGRHACPGRFFVSHELKMWFAHLFMNYDIKRITNRREPLWIGKVFVPDDKAYIELRRKTTAKHS